MQPRDPSNSLPPKPPVLLAAAVLTVAFLFVEHQPDVSRLEGFSMAADELEQAVETGSTRRQAAFLAIGALGVIFLLRGDGQAMRTHGPLPAVLALYCLWCATSLLWSGSPAMTGKRLIVFGLCGLGSLGIARQLTADGIRRAAVAALLCYVVLGVAVEIASGTFRPWQADYRFAGTVHPNHQGFYCGALALAFAVGLRRQSPARAAALVAVLVLLLLTKSRTSCAALAIALPAVLMFRANVSTRLFAFAVVGWIACVAVLLSIVADSGVSSRFDKVLLLGRSDEAETLTGRTPLWKELLAHAARHPLAGHGFDSFWTPARIEEISMSCGWPIQSSHSAYIETLLGVGLIGLLLAVATVGLAFGRLRTAYVATGSEGHGFLLGLLVFGFVCSFLESGFAQPTIIVPFIAACGIAHAAFYLDRHDP